MTKWLCMFIHAAFILTQHLILTPLQLKQISDSTMQVSLFFPSITDE